MSSTATISSISITCQDQINDLANLCSDQVKGIDLSHCRFSSDGWKSISKFLQTTTSIEELTLLRNTIKDGGSAVVMEGLSSNKSVTKLSLIGNDVFYEGGCKSVTKMLTKNETLKEFHLAANTFVLEATKFQRLFPFFWPQDAKICNKMQIKGFGMIMEGLARNKSITVLDLFNNKISTGGCKHVSELLTKNTTLKDICLRCAQLDDEGIALIMKGLVRNNSVAVLDLRRNNFSTEGCKHIANVLTTNNSLKELRLGINNINDEGTGIIMDGLVCSNSITMLDIGNNNFTMQGCKHVAKVLTTNASVSDLCLGGNRINDEGIIVIMEGLMCTRSKNVTKLNLSGSCFGRGGCKCVSQMLRKDTALTSLDLGENNIDDEGIGMIMEGLVHNTSLTKLRLSGNDFTLEGCKSVSHMVTKNTTLTDLDLMCNRIKDEGIGKIMDGLARNRSLTKLRLRGPFFGPRRDIVGDNQFSREGYESMYNMLTSNTTLTHMYLGDDGPWEYRWWSGNKKTIQKIIFQLGLNRTGILQKLEKDDGALSRGEWVETFVNVHSMETIIKSLWEENHAWAGFDFDFAANLSASYFCLRTMHDKLIFEHECGKNVHK